MPVEPKRNVFVYGDLFWDFYNAQNKAVQDKIDWVIELVRTLPLVPRKFLKHVETTNGLYEIRVDQGSNAFRIFCFFEKGNLIILLNVFHKKSNKIPKAQLLKAIRLQKQYHEEYKKE